jgi:hypothetical protein
MLFRFRGRQNMLSIKFLSLCLAKNLSHAPA